MTQRPEQSVNAVSAMRELRDRAQFEPGQWVVVGAHPEWGAGQVQSAVGDRVTVNFEHRGKVLINAALVELDVQP